MDVQDWIIDEFLEASNEAGTRGLMRCSSGNMSMRLEDDRLLATCSRSWMENITAEELSVCRISDGAHLDGPKPTVEIAFHAEILKARSDVNVVLHYQSPAATALSCQDTGDVNYFVTPEIPFYIGHVARIPFIFPGSEELAAAVTEAMLDHNMLVLENHGQVTVAEDYDHAIQNAEFFELACDIIIRSGDKLKPLPETDIEMLLSEGKSASGKV